MSINDYIRKLLNLKEENISFHEDWYVEEIIKGIEVKIFKGILTYKPKGCRNCGHIFDKNIIKHGFKVSRIKLPAVSGFDTYLDLKKQRYYCKHCDSTFTLKTNIVRENCFISNNTKIAIAMEAKKKISEKDIAFNHNVSHSTVNRIIDSAFTTHKPSFNYLPHNMCFDEFKSVKSASGSMSFVFCNADDGELIDIVENRKLPHLIAYFSKFSKTARESVTRIVIDMYKPYITLITEMFPNAEIIIDRFHIVQLFHRALNKTRINVMNNDTDNYNKFKKYWKLLLKNASKVDHTNSRYRRSFKKPMREIDILNYLLDQNDELKASYKLYQDILYCINSNNYNMFNNIIHQGNSNVSDYMKTSLKTMKKYKRHVYDTLKCSYTNGVLEGINNKIKVIKRIAFGYKSFFHFKNRILITQGLLKLKAA